MIGSRKRVQRVQRMLRGNAWNTEAHYKAKRAEDKVSNEEDALPKTAAAQVLARTAVATHRA